jgi:ABC-type transporter Mla subunit MlaD
MNRERRMGTALLTAGALAVAAVVLILAAREINSLPYTVQFADAKGLQTGDRVQIDGVDIGVVKGVELIVGQPDNRVDVSVKIQPKHAKQVRADSTAIIRNISLPNVSGQMIIEVVNPPSAKTAPPLARHATVTGMDNIVELEAWKLKHRFLGGNGKSWGERIGELSDQALKLKEEMKELSADPRFREALDELQEFVKTMKTKGIESADQLRARWPSLKQKLTPLARELRELGRQYLSDQVNQLMDEIERTLRRWEQTKPPAPQTA